MTESPAAPTPAESPRTEAEADAAVLELAHAILDLAREGRTEELLPVLDAGAPVNLLDPAGNSPLMLAAYHGHAALVTALAERGADVDLLNDRGQSPLAGAAFKDDLPVTRALLAAGADPDAGTPSARETARYFERTTITELLG